MTNQCFWCYKVWDGELPCACPRCGEAVVDIEKMTIGELNRKAASKGKKLSMVIELMTAEEKAQAGEFYGGIHPFEGPDYR